MLTQNLASLQSGLVAVKSNLHHDAVVNEIKTQLLNSAPAQLNDNRIQDANQLALDAIRVPGSFADVKQRLDQLQDQREPWVSRWQSLSQTYVEVTKFALSVDAIGIDFFQAFDSRVASRLDWDEEHFEDAKAILAEFVQDPTGSDLEQKSAQVSQMYIDGKRAVSEYKDNFSSFVDDLRAQNNQARERLNGDIERLNAEIARYESAANQIVRALRDIAGIPSWMTWLISEILDGLGITSAEEARRSLDQNYAEQQQLRDQKGFVMSEIDRVSQMEAALERAQSTLVIINETVADIYSRLDAFASEWAQYHHDIVLIDSEMQTAADSASKRSLISRLKLMGSSIEVLIQAMRTYVEIVGGSGIFN